MDVISSDSDPDVEITGFDHGVEHDVSSASDLSLAHAHATTSATRIITSAHLSLQSGHSASTRTITSARINIERGQSVSVSSDLDPGVPSVAGVSTHTNVNDDSAVSSQSASVGWSGIDRLVGDSDTVMESDDGENTSSQEQAQYIETVITATDTLPGPSADTSAGEFQSEKIYHPSGRVADEQSSDNHPVTDKDDEEGQCCPICFDQWTNSGQHRLVSLRCGHLFGQSCIEKWLSGQSGKCPQCNKRARRRDIRVLYAKSLKVADTSEKDEAIRLLEQERKSRQEAELQAAQTRLLLQMARDECRRMAEEINRHKQQLEHYTNLTSSMAAKSSGITPTGAGSGVFTLAKTLKVCETGDCRVMSYCPAMATLCVSQSSSNALFPGFGVKKVSVLDFKTSQYVAIHSKMIRDICVSQQENVVLSASLDKTVRVTSLSSNTVVQTYNLPAPVWSCTWDKDDPVYFYAGMQNGTVHVYDTRNTLTHVQVLSVPNSRSPVVAMQYMKYNPRSTFSGAGLIVGQLDKTSLYEKQQNDYKLHILPLEGNLTSLSVDDGSRHLFTTYRPTQRHPCVRHVLYELSVDPIDNVNAPPARIYTCNAIHTLHGGSTMKILARSQLIAHPTGKGGLLVAGDEASRCLHIWDASSGEVRQKIPIAAAVIDVRSVIYDSIYHLVALTDRQLFVYKWGS